MKCPRSCFTRQCGPGRTACHSTSRARAACDLSINNFHAQRHFLKRDDRCGDVGEGGEATMEFLVSQEQLTEAVEPTVADLDHPTSYALHRVAPLSIHLFATTDNLSDVVGQLNDLLCPPTSIANIGARVLAATPPGVLRMIVTTCSTASSCVTSC